MNPSYRLTLNKTQAHTALKAIELMLRLKLNQPEEIPFALILNEEDFCERRDNAKPLLEAAFNIMYKGRDNTDASWKDAEWYRLYNMYQVLRKAIHDAEHPDSKGVDSYPPIAFTEEPLPGIETLYEGEDAK